MLPGWAGRELQKWLLGHAETSEAWGREDQGQGQLLLWALTTAGRARGRISRVMRTGGISCPCTWERRGGRGPHCRAEAAHMPGWQLPRESHGESRALEKMCRTLPLTFPGCPVHIRALSPGKRQAALGKITLALPARAFTNLNVRPAGRLPRSPQPGVQRHKDGQD